MTRVALIESRYSVLNIWDLPNNALMATIIDPEGIHFVVITPDGDKVAVTRTIKTPADAGSILVYDAAQGTKLFEIDCESPSRSLIRFSMDSSMLIAATDDPAEFLNVIIKVWSAGDGQLLHSIPSHIQRHPGRQSSNKSFHYSIACGATTCVTAFGMILESWDITSGQARGTVQTVTDKQWKMFDQVRLFCFGESEDIVIAYILEAIKVFDVSRGELLRRCNLTGLLFGVIGYAPSMKAIYCIRQRKHTNTVVYLNESDFKEVDSMPLPATEVGNLEALYSFPRPELSILL